MEPRSTERLLEFAEFLETPRIGTLIVSRADGSPVGVPIWFEWDGVSAKMSADRDSAKVRRLRQRPLASLVVANEVGEPAAWIAFDGRVAITGDGGIDLATRLASRYWDLSDPGRRAELDRWQSLPDSFCVLTLVPDRVRTGR